MIILRDHQTQSFNEIKKRDVILIQNMLYKLTSLKMGVPAKKKKHEHEFRSAYEESPNYLKVYFGFH